MSTTDAGKFSQDSLGDRVHELSNVGSWTAIRTLLLPLASLRLTVVLFALSIILVLAGTLAQIDHDIWFVVHSYFRTWFAWIDFQVFFPRAWNLTGGTWFPGGWLLGAALGANLLAAHTLRFKITANGQSLWVGLGLLGAGIALTWLVIQSGLDDTVESELSPQFCNGLWHALRFALGASTLGLGYVLAINYGRLTRSGTDWLWWLGAAFCAALTALALWLFTHPELRLDDSGLRIMWQLIKGLAAAIVLLAGCYWTFGRRAGIVLLHGGIALLMFSELWTGLQAKESQMRIVEGQTKTYSEDIRSVELAIIEKSDPEQDQVAVVPVELLSESAESGELFRHDSLPFDLRVVEYHQNAEVRFAQPGEKTLATHGAGALRVAESKAINVGVGQNQGVDLPALTVELLDKKSADSLGSYLLSPFSSGEPLRIEGQPYELALRFQRLQKPYAVKLIDFRHDVYTGTETPKNFSSEVQILDSEQNVDRTVKIWMNNPLRYRGDTLYQASFDRDNPNLTTLQVMTNSGWMIPYVSCMLVGMGMFYQFGSTFLRFAARESVPADAATGTSAGELLANWKSPSVWVPAVILAIFAGYVFGGARVPKLPATEMQVHQFGELPVAYNGRVKPFDTLARNALTVLSGKGSLEGKSAVEWLLGIITESKGSLNDRILRIENLDVLQTLDLQPRDGFRYSLAELKESGEEYMRQFKLARELPDEKRTLPQKKFMDLARKVVLINTLQESFSSPAVRTDSREALIADFQVVNRQIEHLNSSAPRPVPPTEAGSPWQTILEAERDAIFQQVQKKEVNTATIALRTILDAYAAKDVQKFNAEIADYEKIVAERAAADAEYDSELASAGPGLQRKAAETLRVGRVQFEAFFNHFNPFTKAMALYLVAFVLAGCSWLGWHTTFNRAAHWLLWFTFILHTYALVCRVYISGRPPVTNLYSSAVFIGWAAVLFALVFERIYRFGIGNLLAAVIGFPTLFIAYNLAGDGDTFQVLQAVLDTQFWLATHVVCITLGYSTTLLAGTLGLVYVLMAHVGNGLGSNRDSEQRRHLVRMIYGTLCFATFFSFVGTVLGGLWADDSWGRFWGWDPKENGALMIVIWNALVLHARWGAMIRQRGMAVLAIFGNIVTAWSWFGVNQMGEGLHAYGFRKGMTYWLCVFVASQLLVMLLGCLPMDWFRGKPDGSTKMQEA